MNGISIKPEAEFRVAGIRASLWANPRQGRNGIYNTHRVIVERTYKDATGNFKTTPGLEVNDIPKAILALKKAYEYLTTNGQNSTGPVPDEGYIMTAAPRMP